MNTKNSIVINFYFLNCGSFHILENNLQIQILTFFKTMNHDRTHVKIKYLNFYLNENLMALFKGRIIYNLSQKYFIFT
ncbi:hypothetical protein FFZ99_19135 [Leptospira interrogans]|nr:hypothetical protein B2G47_16895 [Leptospira interrogans serovar Canicola]TQE59824.1 hypothetical protein FFZ99_19135 [Leptospira interrogans]TQE60038.1 hypothetical protein FF006_03890 [Leptospira interrogans]TQE62819.1 hypothetical protein FF001_19030 [Leptospira interrogans]TQE68251.1 hypothetical protein FF002_19040 [Leptospira interrogans]